MKSLQSRLLPLALGSMLVASGSFVAAADAPRLTLPALSPAATLKQKVGLGEITVEYARPSVKGRKIFGPAPALVPYGEVWRTGANTATKVTFSSAVKVEGRDLPAGAYALYTVPGEKEWTVILNKVTGEWGAYTYKQENDAVRVQVPVMKMPDNVLIESLMIDINDIRANSASLGIGWEHTWVAVKLEFGVVKDVVAQIDAAMASGQKLPASLYFSAAQFYLENDLDIRKAKGWIEEATKENPPFFMLYWKAKILAKAGDKPGAEAAARASMAAANGAAKAEYIRLNEAVLAGLK